MGFLLVAARFSRVRLLSQSLIFPESLEGCLRGPRLLATRSKSKAKPKKRQLPEDATKAEPVESAATAQAEMAEAKDIPMQAEPVAAEAEPAEAEAPAEAAMELEEVVKEEPAPSTDDDQVDIPMELVEEPPAPASGWAAAAAGQNREAPVCPRAAAGGWRRGVG